MTYISNQNPAQALPLFLKATTPIADGILKTSINEKEDK